MNILNVLKTLIDPNRYLYPRNNLNRTLAPGASARGRTQTAQRKYTCPTAGAGKKLCGLCALSVYGKILGLIAVWLLIVLTACQGLTPTTAPESSPVALTPTMPPLPPAATTQPADSQPTSQPFDFAPPSGTSQNEPPNQPTTQPLSTPQNGGTAILGLIGQPDSLNPIIENNPSLRELSPLLFDTLLQVDPQTAELRPGLAQKWTYSADGQQVSFTLPTGLLWSNGRPLTAADVVASLQATEHPALLAFSDISAPTPSTLTLTFVKPDCAAVTQLALLPLLPAAEITATVPTGSGPFIVDNWSENKRTLKLTRNPHYRGPAPLLDGLTIRFLSEDELMVAISEGQFDAVGPIEEWSMVNNQSLIINNSQFTIYNYPAPKMIYLAVNHAPVQADPLPPEVRQALTLALDRKAILQTALSGDGQLLAGSLLPGHWAATGLPLPEYNPARARQLLAQAGLKDTDGDGWLDYNGRRLELGIRLNDENALHQALGWLVSSYYRDLGLFARAEGVPFDSVVDDLFHHDFTLALFSWPLLPDPDQRLFWQSNENQGGQGLNFISYNNPRLDDLLDQGAAVPGCDVPARAKIYSQAQQILAEERPVDFLLAPNQHILVSQRLHGLQPGPFAPLTWNSSEWFLEN